MPERIPAQHVTPALSPTIFVIFGITGDLAGAKILPALLRLYVEKRLPQRFAIVGVSRRHFSREELREYLRSRMNVKPGRFYEEDVKHFLDHISHEEGPFDSQGLYANLGTHLKKIDDRWGLCSNKLLQLSVPPSLYETILRELAASKLNLPCSDDTGWTRILVEKPFGNDLATARSLDRHLAELFDERQIFRIDHYLAKEPLQNLIAFRFGNSIFEPVWNRAHIEKVHIKLLERSTPSARGPFYDATGALRDVGQNHLLEMLALVAMERPASMDAAGIRRERAVALSRLEPITRRAIPSRVVRGQYQGFRGEKGVGSDSMTETYFRLECSIGTRRWKGVPFYLESGKGLAEDRVEIDVYFKGAPADQNILTFRIQPEAGIRVRFNGKQPGYSSESESKCLKFRYADVPPAMPDAYERLMNDAIVGDQTLFASSEEIVASWKFITPIIEQWGKTPLVPYPKGAREI